MLKQPVYYHTISNYIKTFFVGLISMSLSYSYPANKQGNYPFSFSLASNYQPHRVWCFCPSDGSLYGFGSRCIVGLVGCESNACPAPPQGCASF